MNALDEGRELLEDWDEAEDMDEWGDGTNQANPDADTPLYERFRVVADAHQAPMRVDKFLMEHLGNTSRSRLKTAADQGFVRVNDTAVRNNYKVKPNDVVTVMLDHPRRETEILPENIPLEIVYEDNDLLVVNKPAGLVVHPGCGNYEGTLVNALAWHLRDNPDYNPNDPGVGLVHRIDKDTSGLLVVAKTHEAKTNLCRQFFLKTTKRQYDALTWGNFDEDEGRIEGNIGRNPKDRLQMTVFPPDSDIGKPAVTHYRVQERFGYVTLVQCVLETGRTHQIRAHMKHIGHPLFNDERYGGNEILRGTQFNRYRQFVHNCFAICPRQALHAHTLGFVHPRTGEELFFSAPMPIDMTALVDKWRAYIANRDTIGG